MAYTDAERLEIRLNCTRFVAYHRDKPMRQLMREIAESPFAELGQDGYGHGGFLEQLEAELATLFGKEAAVIMPSGTMAQQIALRIWSDRAGVPKVAFHPTCHLELHEQMAYRELHHLESVLVGAADSLMTLAQIESIEDPISCLLLELPQREIGGQLPPFEELLAIGARAHSTGVRLHMDGARLWECQPYYGRSYAEICEPFDSVYVSFYKILQGLPGAALAGPADFIKEARIWQRRHGGNLQQQASTAIAAKLGMVEHLPQMAGYCARAQEFAAAFGAVPGVRVVPEVPPTNMMHLYLDGDREVLDMAKLDVAKETRVMVLPRIGPSPIEGVCKVEVPVGNAGMDVDAAEAAELLARIVGA